MMNDKIPPAHLCSWQVLSSWSPPWFQMFCVKLQSVYMQVFLNHTTIWFFKSSSQCGILDWHILMWWFDSNSYMVPIVYNMFRDISNIKLGCKVHLRIWMPNVLEFHNMKDGTFKGFPLAWTLNRTMLEHLSKLIGFGLVLSVYMV
jgi:hypothetical protein